MSQTDPPSTPSVVPAASQISDGQPIIATAARGYRVKFIIAAVVIVVVAAWFGYDGFITYPRDNREVAKINQAYSDAVRHGRAEEAHELTKQRDRYRKVAGREDLAHTDFDIFLQKVLSFALPVLALAMLLRTLYVTRGRYRLVDDVLEVPGHPPVPLSAISQIDRRRWERKGIAMLDYELADGRRGRLKLDDYAYQRKRTDAIFARVEQSLMSAAAPEEPAAS